MGRRATKIDDDEVIAAFDARLVASMEKAAAFEADLEKAETHRDLWRALFKYADHILAEMDLIDTFLAWHIRSKWYNLWGRELEKLRRKRTEADDGTNKIM